MAGKKWQDVLVSLRKIIRVTDMHSKKMVRDYGLTVPQILVLKAINDPDIITIRNISDAVSLSQATVTTILNRLEQRKIVRRERSATDKRAVHVFLTEAGARALSEAPSLLQESFIQRFESLEDWEQNLILSTMQRMAKMMEAGSVDAAPLLYVGAPDKTDEPEF